MNQGGPSRVGQEAGARYRLAPGAQQIQVVACVSLGLGWLQLGRLTTWIRRSGIRGGCSTGLKRRGCPATSSAVVLGRLTRPRLAPLTGSAPRFYQECLGQPEAHEIHARR